MTSSPRYPGSDDDVDSGPDSGSTVSTSAWVYVLFAIGIGLILLMVVLHLTGTVGPGHH